jgi:hypothetical protein
MEKKCRDCEHWKKSFTEKGFDYGPCKILKVIAKVLTKDDTLIKAICMPEWFGCEHFQEKGK